MVVVGGGAVVVETHTRKTDRPCVLLIVVVGSKFDRRVYSGRIICFHPLMTFAVCEQATCHRQVVFSFYRKSARFLFALMTRYSKTST